MKDKLEYEMKSVIIFMFSFVAVLGVLIFIVNLSYTSGYSRDIYNSLLYVVLFGAMFVGAIIGSNARKKATIKKFELVCESKGYKVLHDLTLHDENNKKMHIQHLIITPKGIAIIHINEYTGNISGTAESEKWSYYVRKAGDQYYPNPILQNKKKIQILKDILKQDIQFYNLVLFFDDFRFNIASITDKFTELGNMWHIEEILSRLDKLSTIEIDVDDMYRVIKYSTLIDQSKSSIAKTKEEKGAIQQF